MLDSFYKINIILISKSFKYLPILKLFELFFD